MQVFQCRTLIIHDGGKSQPMVNGMGTSATIVSCGMRTTVCKRLDGMGTAVRTPGHEKSATHLVAGRETVGTGTR